MIRARQARKEKTLIRLDKVGKHTILLKGLIRDRQLYVLLVPAVALVFIFNYIPIYGITIAFKDYKLMKGIADSEWVGILNFIKLFKTVYFGEVVRNTLLISLYRLIIGFPAPIILALLLNEMRFLKFKKTIQIISYLPTFFSWVVLAAIFQTLLSPSRGFVNFLLTSVGWESIYFLADPSWFRSILVSTSVWKGVGYSSVIYLAVISGIDPGLYDAATIDGAGRLRLAWNITIPSLMYVATILLILNLGQILNAGFDQIFNLYSPPVYKVADIIDTYVYRTGLVNYDWSFATAAGLFKNIVGFILVFGTNSVVRKFSDKGLW
ncbi:MAG: sugar ABC transporter permease [Spirochaetales bacterium]|nr:sugar ABC transporter permease [Spirochaetales bacterium]